VKKYFLLLAFFLALILSSVAQESNPNYDAALAEKLGGDDYGMKGFMLVILKTGSNTSTDSIKRDSCFRGHLANINKLAKENKLVVAGPLGKNESNYRGIFILNVGTKSDAEALLATDPAIAEGYLAYDMYKWYGSAALPEYLKADDKIWKKKP
jgi:uncharacterized protein YciI